MNLNKVAAALIILHSVSRVMTTINDSLQLELINLLRRLKLLDALTAHL